MYTPRRYISLIIRIAFLPLLCSLVFAMAAAAQGDKVEFQLDVPDVVTVGENFNAYFTVSAKGKDFRLDPPSGLEVLYGPQQSSRQSTTIINGHMTRSSFTTYTYVFLAQKEGKYVIPSATVKVGTATYRTSPRTITAVASSRSSAAGGSSSDDRDASGRQSAQTPALTSKDIFVDASVSKREVYEQEGILVTFKIYSSYDFNFEGVKFPDFDGFLAQDIEMPQTLQLQTEERNGKIYRSVVIKKTMLFPQRSGTLTIPQGRFDLQMQLPVQQQFDSMDSFFDSFFSSVRTVRKSIQSNAVTIRVKPLPQPAPSTFTGAVGEYRISADTPPSIVKANESYRLRYTLSGKGNIKLVSLPRPSYPDGFDAYDPQESEELSVTTEGVSGTKTSEFFAVPRFPGDYTIPGLLFTYFDPSSHSYKDIRLPDTRLHVDPADPSGTTATGGGDYTSKEEIKYLGKDIRYLKDLRHSSHLGKVRLSVWGAMYVFVALLSVALYFLALLSRRRRQQDSYLSKSAGRQARKWLKVALSKRKGAETSAYYEALLRGLYGFVGNKFHLPLSVLNRDSLCETLRKHHADELLVEETLSVLSELELSRYAPTTTEVERETLYNRVADIINRLDNIRVR